MHCMVKIFVALSIKTPAVLCYGPYDAWIVEIAFRNQKKIPIKRGGQRLNLCGKLREKMHF